MSIYSSFHGEIQNNKEVDKVLREYFPDYGYKGVFLDIGAFEPIEISNSYHFEKNGWDVYCFEANTNQISLLKKERKNVYNYAIYDEDKDLVDFNVVTTNGWTAGFSSVEISSEYLKIFPQTFEKLEKIKVPQKKMNNVLENEIPHIKEIDIISLDVGGGELKCLKGLDLEKYKPKIMVIENVSDDKTIEEYLFKYGYILDKQISYNQYYKKEIEEIESEYIRYLSGGRLGDFMYQLSVINENYIKKNKKGILYICEKGDIFTEGLDYTYNDTFELIMSQPYIKDYKIYKGEKYDIDLTLWRNEIHTPKNIYEMFNSVYDLTTFGKNKWFFLDDNLYKNEILKNTIFINTKEKRFYSDLDYDFLYEKYGDNLVYLSCGNKNEYDAFTLKTNIKIKNYITNSFKELCIAINSCLLFVGGLTMPLTIAQALKKDLYFLCYRTSESLDSENRMCERHVSVLDKVWNNVKYLKKKKIKSNENNLVYLINEEIFDFLVGLKIINEYFIKTGKKGIIYLLVKNEEDDLFFVEKEKEKEKEKITFEETYNLIINQSYVKNYIKINKNFKIENYKNIDIDLTCNNNIFELDKNKWLNMDIINRNRWGDNTILINMKSKIDLKYLNEKNVNVVFISYVESEFYNFLENNKGIKKIEYYKPETFENLCIVFNSCNMFIGSYSFYLLMAFSMKKDVITISE